MLMYRYRLTQRAETLNQPQRLEEIELIGWSHAIYSIFQ